jgi:hypothetical protein
MPSPIATVNDVPVYAEQDDLPADQQEHGNLAVTVQPPTFWIWLETPGAWVAITSTTSSALQQRVTRLEQRLACLADCLSSSEPDA